MKPIYADNKVEQLYYQMKRKIIKNEWGPGQKLPSERELGEIFGVSRVSVRGAIQKLKSLQMIETFQGKGSFVVEKINVIDNMFPRINISNKDFLDIIEFRELIELKSIELAVERADETDLENIHVSLEKMLKHTNNYKEYSKADYEFHLAIIKASKNKIFLKAMESIGDIFQYYLEELNRVFEVTEGSINGHKKLYEAIKDKNTLLAKEIIEAGIEENYRKMYIE